MARTQASARTQANARVQASTRSAGAVWRIPIALLNIGVTSLWDFSTGYTNADSGTISDRVDSIRLSFLGSSALSNIYTTGEYSADLESTNSDYFRSQTTKISQTTITRITLFSWFKRENTNAANSLVGHWRVQNTQRGFELRCLPSAQSSSIAAFLSLNGSAVTQYSGSTGLWTDTNWHFGAWSYDGNTMTMLMSNDGVAISNSLIAGSAPASINDPTCPVSIGTIFDASGNPTNLADGKVGICGIALGTAMTQAQMTELYNTTRIIGSYT